MSFIATIRWKKHARVFGGNKNIKKSFPEVKCSIFSGFVLKMYAVMKKRL